MCFFRRKKKAMQQAQVTEPKLQKQVPEEPKHEEPIKSAELIKPEEPVIVVETKAPEKPVVTEPKKPIVTEPEKPAVTEPEKPVISEPVVPVVTSKPAETVAKEEPVAKPTKPESSNRYSGKYEIYPEAGGFKYRLKASNGEILIVSQAYASKMGAASGIETLKKNVAEGVFEFYTDKSNYTQFLLFSANKSRLIATGEFYESVQRCQSASESVKKFYTNEKIIYLDAIDPQDMREELVEFKPVEAAPNGKFEFELINGEYVFHLKASNGEVLFESNGYSTKTSAMQSLDVIKKAIEADAFRIMKDKVGRYQFKLFATNKALLVTGETYPNHESCLSAIDSVRRFYQNAKIVE